MEDEWRVHTHKPFHSDTDCKQLSNFGYEWISLIAFARKPRLSKLKYSETGSLQIKPPP